MHSNTRYFALSATEIVLLETVKVEGVLRERGKRQKKVYMGIWGKKIPTLGEALARFDVVYAHGATALVARVI